MSLKNVIYLELCVILSFVFIIKIKNICVLYIIQYYNMNVINIYIYFYFGIIYLKCWYVIVLVLSI